MLEVLGRSTDDFAKEQFRYSGGTLLTYKNEQRNIAISLLSAIGMHGGGVSPCD